MVKDVVPPAIRQWLHQVLSPLPLNLKLNFWHQEILLFASDEAEPSSQLTLTLRHPGVLRSFFHTQDPLVLTDAYLAGFLDVEGDLAAIIPVVQRHCRAQMNRLHALQAWLASWRLPTLPTMAGFGAPWKEMPLRTRDRDQAVIRHHYNTGNAFYQLWLDPQMVYSCAYFEHPHMTLQQAQEAKLDRICRKLKLAPGDMLLDIGCGWGGLLRWAVQHYGVKAHGITLSDEQLAYNQQRIADLGLGEAITVELLDYRDLPPVATYDKVVSVGMVEHVGVKNYADYFGAVLAALKPGGLFLNHGIASRDSWQGSSLGEQFMDRYIFPDGEITPLSTQLMAAEEAGWEIVDVDGWRSHYAQTLRCWVQNFEAALEPITELIGDRPAQLWRLYLIGSALGFENNQMGLYQTVLRRKQDTTWNLPLTRAAWLC